LHAEGINQFRPYRLDALERCRFPIFLRRANEHFGPLTEPLADKRALDAALAKLKIKGRLSPEVIAVEYLDARGGDGLFRKYSAFNIAGKIMPRHLIFSDHWVQKFPGNVEPARLEEEQRYLQENPHREILKQVFELANIDYGRVDYGVVDGKIQVWEINSNPYLLQAPAKYPIEHLPNQSWFASEVGRVLSELASSSRSHR
jgi:hypothetical protein